MARPTRSCSSRARSGNLGDYTHALDLLHRSLDLRQALGPASRKDLTLRAFGVLYNEVEDYAKAQAAFEQALAANEPARDALGVSPILGSLAALYNDQGQPNQALAMATRALAIDDEYRNVSGIALDSLEAGRALQALERYDEAEAQLERALNLARKMRQDVVVARVELYRALGAEARGRNDEALALLASAARAFKSEDARPFLLQALAASARIAGARGDFKQAHALELQRSTLREKLLGAQSSRRIAGVVAEYEQQQQKQQIALLTKDNELKALRIERDDFRRNVGLAAIALLVAVLGLVVKRYALARRHNVELEVRNQQIDAQRRALTTANAELERSSQALYQAAISDPLTNVYNRGHVLKLLRDEIPRSLAIHAELALLIVDFDFFKRVNDTYGHAFGDKVLVAGVERIRDALGGTGFFGRYGGEEFLIVLPGAGRERALEVGERVRRAVAESLEKVDAVEVAQTISVGAATLSACAKPTDDALLVAADEALYAAKGARTQLRRDLSDRGRHAVPEAGGKRAWLTRAGSRSSRPTGIACRRGARRPRRRRAAESS
jgi:diguanylate cyclase (GGDEF)-like protein